MSEPAVLPDFYVDSPASLLEAAFERIERERMVDVPLLNKALTVAAVGFQRWEAYWCGVLVTPWFINLMLLPAEPGACRERQVGENIEIEAPSGAYQFAAGFEEQIGPYLFCSLISPVNDFADQASALAVADDVMRLFMLPPEHRELALQDQAVPGRGQSRRAGQERISDSRRSFLRGRMSTGKD